MVPSTKETVVFVVDDDSQMRKSLCRLLESAGYVSEDYASAVDFLDRYDPARPGCLLLDVRMPAMSGLELQAELTKAEIAIPIIIISGFADVPTAVQAMKKGALDVLEKPFDDERLLAGVERAMLEDQAARRGLAARSEAKSRIAALTNREREIMQCLANGKTTKQIARDLGISSKTADVHRAKVLTKLNIDNVVQLTNILHDLDLAISPPSDTVANNA